ncbi:hypothetical protein PENPOL_c002G07909 [Penicillium polonicum]|uniref:FAD-dependent monooxygenase verC2 n=1 Tax=Penicillium polonicum TaxID=60169 RepID=VERC2_PENPO|nr:RecName: Full=FAD-dependent monooxygenase verC2; AltName: Full=Cluster 4 protein C2; AltName: Full=Verrucosidin biosynthesis cluster protein C2 [Penicillium polonicum]OQD69870.1 hypothetical protein PENPOL_c002G07909 [Penicillium polonicum]
MLCWELANRRKRIGPNRFGFPIAILTRQQLIEVLYTALSDKSKVKTGKKVVRIESEERRITTWTEDGSEYEGELVVGADGVHSVTRSEMWRAADNQQPGFIQEEEKYSLSAEYSCIWGLSTPVPGIRQGEQIIRSYDRLTFLIFPSQNGCLGWFAIQKLNRKHVYPDIRPFSQKDTLARCEALRDLPIWNDVKFGDLLTLTEVCAMTPLEENLFQTWNYGRILCIGDSISKLTPNIAQGANTAIEGAAAVANGLHQLLHHNGLNQPSYDEIQEVLGRYSQSQRKRMKKLHWISHMVTRLQSREGLINKFVGRYIYSHTGNSTFYLTGKMIAQGPVLNYLSTPKEIEIGLRASFDQYGKDGGDMPWKTTIMFIALLTIVVLIYSFI